MRAFWAGVVLTAMMGLAGYWFNSALDRRDARNHVRRCADALKRYQSVDVCVTGKDVLCFYGPEDLYNARKDFEFLKQQCKAEIP